jgi:hypothetical protein
MRFHLPLLTRLNLSDQQSMAFLYWKLHVILYAVYSGVFDSEQLSAMDFVLGDNSCYVEQLSLSIIFMLTDSGTAHHFPRLMAL